MSAYTDRADRGLMGLIAPSSGLCPGCEECEDASDEGSFSWSGCGICNSTLGGDRYVWHYLDEDGEVQHERDACFDCVMYMSNGDDPELSHDEM